MKKKSLTERILEDNGCPYHNQYQGTHKRLVFVCSAGLLRSPTAAVVAAKLGYNTRSCGSADIALIRLSANLVEWADKIIFMNSQNRLEAADTFSHDGYYMEILREKSVLWNIEDDYDYMEAGLVREIEYRLADLKF